MRRLSRRKVKKLLERYNKVLMGAALLAVVGIGIMVSHVLAITNKITIENLSLTGNYYNLRAVGTTWTALATLGDITIDGNVTNESFEWTNNTGKGVLTLETDPAATGTRFTQLVTTTAPGYDEIKSVFSPSDGSAQVEAKIGVVVPLESALSTDEAGNNTVDSTKLYSLSSGSAVFYITGQNISANNQLDCYVFRNKNKDDNNEITSDSNDLGLGSDVRVEPITKDKIKVTFLKSGVYTISAVTQDYKTLIDKPKELRDDFVVQIEPEFSTEAHEAVDGVNFLKLEDVYPSVSGVSQGAYKYGVIEDITKEYSINMNTPEHGSLEDYGLLWNVQNTGIIQKTGPDQKYKIYEGIQGKYAGISQLQLGIARQDANGTAYAYYTDDCYIIVPFIWGMDGIKTQSNGLADKEITMNVNDTYLLTTSGHPDKTTYLVDQSNATVTKNDAGIGVFQATKEGDYVVSVYLNSDQFTTNVSNAEVSKKFIDLMGQQKIQITIHVIDSFSLSEERHDPLYVGDSFTLTALTTDETVPVEYRWESLPDETEGVVSNGQITWGEKIYRPDTDIQVGQEIIGKKAGYVRVTASQTINGVTKSASCVVHIIDKPIEVDSIQIVPDTLTMDRGTTSTVEVVFNNNQDDPANQTVFWSSSDVSIAEIESNGNGHTATITANKGGDVVLMVVSQDGMKSATCKLHVREPVTGVKLNYSQVNASLKEKSLQLVATVTPSGEGVNRDVTWESTDSNVVSVDDTGLVTYHSSGYATIVCTTDDGHFKAYCTFYINLAVEELKLDKTDVILSVDEQLRLTAEVLPLNATQRTVSWESSDVSVCTVDSNGLVTAKGVGYATILCKTIDGSELTAMCKVYVKQPVTSVQLNVHELTVRKGTVFWLNASCFPENADNKLCAWTSNDEEVCEVDENGMVTAVGSGVCNIICTNVDSGVSDYCVVTVTQPVTGLTLNSDYQSMWVGAKYAIIANVLPTDADNKKVTFKTSDETVATVDADGVVTALKGGSCVITVTTDELELKATCTIDVKEYVTSVELSEDEKYMNQGTAGELTVKVGTDTATNKDIRWSTSNASICNVVDGKLLAGVPGTAVITATAADGSGVSDTCIVHVVIPVTSVTVEPSEIRILVGDSYKLNATVYPEQASVQDVRWESSNEAIATVDSDGEVVGLAVGKCKVTAYSKDGNDIKASCSVYVSPVVQINSLKINSTEITMLAGKTRKLSAFVTPTNTTESVGWYSTDTSIVAVTDNGTITTVGPGIADVVVYGGTTNITASCRVHSLAMSQTNITLGQYDTFDLAVDGASGFTVAWRTSNPRIATVDNTGHVVARMRGTTTITATVDDKTLSCVVNVGTLY